LGSVAGGKCDAYEGVYTGGEVLEQGRVSSSVIQERERRKMHSPDSDTSSLGEFCRSAAGKEGKGGPARPDAAGKRHSFGVELEKKKGYGE